MSAAAGLARVLPMLLDPEVPARAARPFLLGLSSLSLEVGALVGWSLGWTEVAVRSHERGEARARMALGEPPFVRIARAWPAIVVLVALTAASSLAWGRDARAPGRVARALIEEGRRACEAATEPRVIDVPLVRASWLCRPGRAPILVGQGAGSASALDFAASTLSPADDLASVAARDVQVLLPTSTPTTLHLDEVRIVGLVPFTAPSSVPPWLRATAVALAALASAARATAFALRETTARAAAWGVAISGPAAALAVLRACERAAISDLRLMVVPLAAAATTIATRWLVASVSSLVRRRRPRYAPQPSRPSLP